MPSASSGVPVVDFINYAMGISKTVDGIDTEDGDKPQPKLYDYRSGKVIGKPKTVGDAAKMAGLKLENVELGEVVNAKDKKVIDDFVQANKGTGAQNFTQRGSIVDYEGRSLEKSGMGAQQIASIESDPKDSHKIKIRAKMDGKSTQSIVNYLKKSAKKYNIKVEHFERKFSSDVVETADNFNNEYLFVENNLKILQNIVKKKQNSKMKFKDNKTSIVDLYTASAIMNVYNAVKKDNKKKMEKLINGTLADFLKVQGVAFKAHRS